MLISTELVDELRAFARPRVSGKLFADLAGTRTIYNWIKEYARTARIEDWNYVTSNTLQNFFARSSSEFRAEVDKLPEAGLARRMSEYYIANYCLERDIRRLISETLRKNDEDWWKHKVPALGNSMTQ